MSRFFNTDILLEVVLAFFYLVPISVFRYVPFKNKLRFSVKLTVILYFAFFFTGNIILILTGKYDNFIIANQFRFVFYTAMILFSFLLVKDHIGKQLYVICFYANYTFLFSAFTLFSETLFLDGNSFNLIFKVISMAIALLIAIPFIYYTSFKPLSAIVKREIPKIWNFLWIAGVIQLLLNNALTIPYRDNNDNLVGRNAIIRLAISLGSLLINHIILYLIKGMLDANDKNMALLAEKQQYAIQEYQYRNIKEQIEASKRFRHDFKHHNAVISSIVSDTHLSNDEKLQRLTDYCREYSGSVPEAEEQHFCDNYPLNLLLNYYYGKALEKGYPFTARVDVPSHMSIPDTEICVIVGNLLLNASEAVVNAPDSIKQISITISKFDQNLLILVENGFDGQLNQSNDIFHSTKHKGEGIGIPSIRNIVSKYNGNCYFEHKEKVFTAKIHLYLEY